MYFRLLFLLGFFLLYLPSCKKEMLPDKGETLINEKGWETISYRRYDPDSTTEFSTLPAYIILGEYGDALLFGPNGDLWINYSTGQGIDKTQPVKGSWSVKNDTLFFTNNAGENLPVELVETKKDFLWIKYLAAGDIFEYKLLPIGI